MKPVYSEKYLLQKVADGDVKAFEMLYLEYRPLLASFIFKLSKSAEVSEEVVQDVFIKIWTHREKLADVHSFPSYLFVVARHHALNVLRKSVSERNKLLSFYKQAAIVLEEEADVPDFYAELDEAINRLPEQQKKVYVLCRQEGMGHQAVADYLGLSSHTVKKYMKLAVGSIKKYLLLKSQSGGFKFIFLLWMLN